MPKLPIVKFRELSKAVKKAGFVHVRTVGSHFYYRNHKSKITISIPNHGPKPLGKGLVKSILNDAGIKPDDFIKLLKG